MSRTEFTPAGITALGQNEIFVFGSNLAGHHGGGAARIAIERFGAVWGQGVGIQGKSYAIPTMQGPVETLQPYVDAFIEFAKRNPDLRFLVTPIGCGIAGFKPADIAPLFQASLDIDNIILPKAFVEILTGNSAFDETRCERKARLVAVFQDTLSMIAESTSLSKAVEKSIFQTKFYPKAEKLPTERRRGKQLKVSVTEHRSFQAAERMHSLYPEKRIAVLNFASATSPGGGVKSGSSAQEESLCRCSTLFPVLAQEALQEKYYFPNKRLGDNLYTDACIYTPGIKIFKSEESHPKRLPREKWIDADVITCAAPNLRKAEPLPADHLYGLHLRHGRRILDVALDNHAEVLILGAFGCGAFRNDPKVVANAYATLMEEYREAFDEVEFAIFHKGSEIANYDAFQKALSP